MKVVFLGVGEAFDENLVNNSHIIWSETKLLLDCGYAIPRHLWRHYPDKDFLDAMYLTHPHADHYLGTPVLWARLWEEQREKPLKVIAQTAICRDLPTLMEYAYRGLLERFPFPIEYVEVNAGDRITVNELTLTFAASQHSAPNLAVRVESGGRSVCYSGDGMFSDATKELYRGADLLIHEAFAFEQVVPAHAGIKEVIRMAEEVGVRALALTHLNRELRKAKAMVLEYIQKLNPGVRVLLPEPLEEFAW